MNKLKKILIKMSSEIQFMQHCDDENCSMGTAEFECPNCSKWNVDYNEIFYGEYEIYRNNQIETCCEHCKVDLIAYYNEETSQSCIKLK